MYPQGIQGRDEEAASVFEAFAIIVGETEPTDGEQWGETQGLVQANSSAVSLRMVCETEQGRHWGWKGDGQEREADAGAFPKPQTLLS